MTTPTIKDVMEALERKPLLIKKIYRICELSYSPITNTVNESDALRAISMHCSVYLEKHSGLFLTSLREAQAQGAEIVVIDNALKQRLIVAMLMATGQPSADYNKLELLTDAVIKTLREGI